MAFASVAEYLEAIADNLAVATSEIKRRILGTYPSDIIQNQAIASFPDGADGIPVKDLTVAIEPVQSGSGDPSPTNIRPISGWSGAEVTRTGVNVWDEEWEVGAYSESTGAKGTDNTNIRSKNYISVFPNTSYHKTILASEKRLRVFYYDANKNYIDYNTNNATFTTPSNCYYLTLSTLDGYGTTYNHDISINYPSTDTSYHTYNGNTYNISWQTEAGTVYGGTLDVTTGVLTVTHGVKTFDGTESWSRSAITWGYAFYTALNTLVKTPPTSEGTYIGKIICDKLQTMKSNNDLSSPFTVTGYWDYGSSYPAQNWIYIRIDDSITDAVSAKAWLESNPITVVYELATPTTVQLTAAEVETVLGLNNIWADSGNVIELEYYADTKMYIQKIMAE